MGERGCEKPLYLRWGSPRGQSGCGICRWGILFPWGGCSVYFPCW